MYNIDNNNQYFLTIVADLVSKGNSEVHLICYCIKNIRLCVALNTCEINNSIKITKIGVIFQCISHFLVKN